MSITYCVGNPGSGKSYFAVYKIWENFHDFNITKKNYKKKFDNCYTNINQFKFDEFDNVIKFDFGKIKEHLTTLYNMYENDQTDEELILYCEDNNLFNSYFVLDEIHNIFKSKDDDVLVWWLTYHRHLHHELLFITQDLSLVHNEYKRIAEFFYKAVDSGKRLFSKKFKYIQFSNYRMYQNSIIKGGGISLEFKQEIFNLYHSGNSGSNNNIVRKYILIFLFLILISIVGFSLFIKNLKGDSTATKSTINNNKELVKNLDKNFSHIIKNDDNKTYIYNLTCSDNTCYINNNYNSFPFKYYLFLMRRNNVIFMNSVNTFKNQLNIFLIFDKPVFENLKRIPNENEDMQDNIAPALKLPSFSG